MSFGSPEAADRHLQSKQYTCDLKETEDGLGGVQRDYGDEQLFSA